MAQDNTPAIVMYKGAQEDGYSIPFDKGYYGEVKVAFVRRGLTDYEYMPTTYTVDGALYAWEISTGVYYYTKSASPAVDATVYNSGNHEISGVKVVSTQNASASFSDGKTGIRSNKKDIHSHALLFWTGEPLGDDDWICIVRETVKKQPYSYPNNQKHIEGALDNLSRQIQELKAQSDVSLKVDPTFVQDPAKMNPIDWLNTIVRSTDTTARGLRYRNFWLEYSTDDPNKAESDKSWTKLLNTTNITSVREWYDEDNKVYIPQYSMDGGATWKSLPTFAEVYTKTEIDGKLTAVESQIDANADAIQKTREDYIAADSEIHQILNSHADELTTLRGNQASLGDQVSGIEEKIPGNASASNQLATKADLANIDLDGYVKKSGDTMTGDLAFEDYSAAHPQKHVLHGDSSFSIKYYYNNEQYPRQTWNFAGASFFASTTTGVKPFLGHPTHPWDNVYAKQLNNGADVAIPTEGGTLARIEDLIDLRADINEADSELQTQIAAQAAEIATKQDQLVAGDNIVISGNTISATGAGGGAGLDTQVVDQLPATGQKGIIYLLAKDGAAPDVYDEYVWIESTQTFELIGTTQVDLTDYAKKEELDNYLPLTGGKMTGAITFSDTAYSVSHNTSFNGLTISTSSSRGFVFTNSGRSSIHPTSTGAAELGQSAYRWNRIYAIKLNNGADIAIPTTGGTMALKEDIEQAVATQNLTVGSGEGTLYIGDVAGTATIATNNGLDIAAKTKFDTAPTTDDNTTYANALDTSLVRKAQVATAIADAMANVDALPDQTGNAEKVLTTDGTNASWTEMPGLIIRRL